MIFRDSAISKHESKHEQVAGSTLHVLASLLPRLFSLLPTLTPSARHPAPKFRLPNLASRLPTLERTTNRKKGAEDQGPPIPLYLYYLSYSPSPSSIPGFLRLRRILPPLFFRRLSLVACRSPLFPFPLSISRFVFRLSSFVFLSLFFQISFALSSFALSAFALCHLPNPLHTLLYGPLPLFPFSPSLSPRALPHPFLFPHCLSPSLAAPGSRLRVHGPSTDCAMGDIRRWVPAPAPARDRDRRADGLTG